LLYPRRAYFERIAEPEEPAGTTPSPPRPLSDAYRTLVALVEAGPTGEVTRLAVPTGEPTEPVGCFRDHPYLLKVSRVRTPLDPRTVLDRQPQYLLELGLRCAAVDDGQGWLLIGHDRDGGLGPIDAFAVRFDPLDAIAQVGLDRLQGLDEAFRTRRPDRLPACPAWMATDCPYRDRCGCATPAAVDGTRSR
ncbi:MAG TPA: hypothetical protein VLX64_04760, partial [Thermoplasmata archaeon]|nr:hypothetical protein [Thermoplasmata archaeon]